MFQCNLYTIHGALANGRDLFPFLSVYMVIHGKKSMNKIQRKARSLLPATGAIYSPLVYFYTRWSVHCTLMTCSQQLTQLQLPAGHAQEEQLQEVHVSPILR
jgi:hypothetical protein